MSDSEQKPARQITAKKDPAYWQALGEFIEAFALTEMMLFSYLARLSGVTNEVAKAVFSGARTEVILQFITRIWEVKPPPQEIERPLTDAFRQMRAINSVRNDLIHNYSLVYSDIGRAVSNYRALTPDRERITRASPEVLAELTNDVRLVLARVIYALAYLADGKHSETLAPALKTAWKYKPPPDHQKKVK